MLRTVEAMIDETGKVRLSEPVELKRATRALVTILDEPDHRNECAILSEAALADWTTPEEDEAWKDLGDLPALPEEP